MPHAAPLSAMQAFWQPWRPPVVRPSLGATSPYLGTVGGLSDVLSRKPFRGAADTLRQMKTNALGPRGETSLPVRELTEHVTRGIWPKDYLGEILAIRNFCTDHIRYLNDPRHAEWVRDPEALAAEIKAHGVASADCDEIAQMIGTMALQVGRSAEFVVVGFNRPGEYSHVFCRVLEPKTGQWIVCDPVAGNDERNMCNRVTTHQIWSLDEWS